MVSVKISQSDRTEKKMKAVFYDNDGKKIKTTHFGASGYTDFIKSGGDQEREKRQREDIDLIRLEQLFPLPVEEIEMNLAKAGFSDVQPFWRNHAFVGALAIK